VAIMEDDDIETSSGSSLLPVALAVLAIVLGGAGLYFGMTANQRINPLADTMEAGSGNTARLEKDIAAFETRIAELRTQYAELEQALSRTRQYGNLNEQTIKQVAAGMQENRTELVKLAGRLNELLASGAPAPAPATAITRADAPSAESDAAAESRPANAPGTYAIQSGDNFVKVANKLGIGLQALIDANPGVDPRRLRIGQEINIPAN